MLQAICQMYPSTMKKKKQPFSILFSKELRPNLVWNRTHFDILTVQNIYLLFFFFFFFWRGIKKKWCRQNLTSRQSWTAKLLFCWSYVKPNLILWAVVDSFRCFNLISNTKDWKIWAFPPCNYFILLEYI